MESQHIRDAVNTWSRLLLTFFLSIAVHVQKKRNNMSDLIHLTDTNFEEIIKNSNIPVLVDFSATWCGPCKMLTPIIEELASELLGKVKVCKIDIDESPNSAQRLGVKGVPAVIVFNRGEKTNALVGLTTKAKLRKLIE